MKYVFISDVHGQFDKMVDALAAAKFNPETDTLVTLGDLFDRGPQSKEVLEYVMSTPHHICVWGNHDLRLKQVLLGAKPNTYDNMNGMRETLKSFCGLEKNPSLYWGVLVFRSDRALRKTYNLLWDYLDSCVNAIEFPNLIGVHAWFPYEKIYKKNEKGEDVIVDYRLEQDWRNANRYQWEEAFWANTEDLICTYCLPDKDVIVGHWHAWRIANTCGVPVFDYSVGTVADPGIDCRAFMVDCGKMKVIFIDGCSNYEYGGCVNAYTYESDVDPIIYR